MLHLVSRWANYQLPAIVAALGILFLTAATGIDGWVYWLVLVFGFFVVFWAAVYVVGFLYGLFGVEPYDKTQAFYTGWDLGMRLTRRTGRWH